MDFDKMWTKALKHTEIIRTRVQALSMSGDTKVPYLLLSESTINIGDTVVRKGEVLVQKPSLFIPPNNPQFEGFKFEDEVMIDENSLINFLLVRGVSLPSLRYDNRTSSLDIFEGKLSDAIKFYNDEFQKQENVSSGLVVGPEDVWQLSLLIFICMQIERNANSDIQRLMNDYKNNRNN